MVTQPANIEAFDGFEATTEAMPDALAQEPYRNAFDHAVIGMGLVDLDGRWIKVNPSLCAIVGYIEHELLATDIQAVTHPEDLPADLEYLRQLREGEIFSQQGERRYLHRRGHVVWVQLSISLARTSEGEPEYYIFQIQDITDRKTSESELDQAHEELKRRIAELEQRTVELRLVSETSELLQSCRSVAEAYKILGKSLRELFRESSGALCVMNAARDHAEMVLQWGEQTISEDYFTPDDCWALRRNRLHVVQDVVQEPVCLHVPQNEPLRYMCLPLTAQRETLGLLSIRYDDGDGLTAARQQLARAVSDQISLALANLHLQETLRGQSVRDPLTGLFNRRYLEESLDRELNRAHRNGQPLSLIMLDVDHFKRFNDSYGHEAGDIVLKAVADLMQASLRKADICCRYGGEEFTLILPEANTEGALQKAEQLRTAAQELVINHDREKLGITISLGVATYRQNEGACDLLLAADAALYQAKASGRNRVYIANTTNLVNVA